MTARIWMPFIIPLMLGSAISMAVAQDQSGSPADAAKKALEDRLAAAKAAKELADAEKAAADAQKAAADARKAQYEADLAAFKAGIGEVPTSGYTGKVDLADKAGTVEATLLAARSINIAAQKISTEISLDKQRNVLLFATSEVPKFQASITFATQVNVVKKGFDDALKISQEAHQNAPGPSELVPEGVPVAAAAGLTLDAVNKLLGYFRTDYKIGGIDLTFDDSILIHSLAGFIANSQKSKGAKVLSVYNPAALSDSGSKIFQELTKLTQLKADSSVKANRHDELFGQFTDAAGKESDSSKKTELLNKAKIHKAAADALKVAISTYESFFTKFTTATDKGAIPLADAINEGAILDELNGNQLLVVKLQKFGGAYYTKHNIVTFFGGMPFFHMGGVVASYLLMDGNTGRILNAGVVPVHGGFIKANELANTINMNLMPLDPKDSDKVTKRKDSQN